MQNRILGRVFSALQADNVARQKTRVSSLMRQGGSSKVIPLRSAEPVRINADPRKLPMRADLCGMCRNFHLRSAGILRSSPFFHSTSPVPMNLRHRFTIFALTGAGVAAALGLGYQDTPLIPGTNWHVHDGTRPQPKVITPGAKAGDAPSDAVVLFDGKE